MDRTETHLPPVVVRPAEASDVPDIIILVREVLAEFGLTFGQGATTDDELYHLPSSYEVRGGRFWIATDAMARLAGTVGVMPVGEGMFELRKMYLRANARGHRIGARLFETALDFARSNGGGALVLDTLESMTAAIAFYERRGFVRDDAQMRATRCSRGYRLDLAKRS
jgi:putative acetyltransferase